MKPRPTHTAARRRLIAMLVVTGGLAIAGGLLLIVQPDGHLLRLSTDTLASTPFATYLVPGLVLAVVVGGAQLFAARAVIRRDPHALRLSLIAGLILGGWIVIQAIMLGATSWLQAVFFVVAMVELMMVAANLPRQPSRKGARRRR